MGVKRCDWAEGHGDDYIAYHDEEWGVPVRDDRVLFEFLTLEGAQAGLSWSTILNKRAGYQRLFAGFDPGRVARFTEKDVQRLLADPGIVRRQDRSDNFECSGPAGNSGGAWRLFRLVMEFRGR